MSLKQVFFKTFGCRTNIYDTQVMMKNLKDFAITKDENSADIIVVNSCTVTNSADSTARNYINKMSKKDKKIVLAGCGAISKGENLFESKKVFGVFGHSEKENINSFLKKDERFCEIGDLKFVDKTIVSNYVGKSRAFIKIQEGCNFRCSYCIIPHVRGDVRSQDESRILKQIKDLIIGGYSEFILTGTNIGSYGKDKDSTLGKLLKKIGSIRGVKRVRLGSIEPFQIDDDFRDVLKEEWLERHLHIALQHTDKDMLKIMRRRNKTYEDIELFCELSQMGYALGTDFIVGHPGESKQRFENAVATLKKFPLTHIHPFTYSKREGTPSALMKEQVRGDEAKKRLKRIVDIVDQKNYAFRKSIQKPLKVLIEEKKGDFYSGFDQFYNKILIKSEQDILKEWVSIENFEAKKDLNYGVF